MITLASALTGSSGSLLIPAPSSLKHPFGWPGHIPITSQNIPEDLFPSPSESWGCTRSSSLPPSPSPPLSFEHIVTEHQSDDAHLRARSHSVTQLLVESTTAAPGARTKSVHSSTRIVDRTPTLVTTLNRETSESIDSPLSTPTASIPAPSFSLVDDDRPATSALSTATPARKSTMPIMSSSSSVILEPRFDAAAYYALALAGPAYYHEQLALGGGASSSSSYARPSVRRRQTRQMAHGEESERETTMEQRIMSDQLGQDKALQPGCGDEWEENEEEEEQKAPPSASMKIKARYEASLLSTTKSDWDDVVTSPPPSRTTSSKPTSRKISTPSFSSASALNPSFSSVSTLMIPSHTPIPIPNYAPSSSSSYPSYDPSSSSEPSLRSPPTSSSRTNRGWHRRLTRNAPKTHNTKLYDQAACYALALAGPVYYQSQCARANG